MRLRFSNAAQSDLSAIYDYGLTNFGLRVAQNYLAKVRNAISLIEQYPMLAPERPDIIVQCRFHPVGSHVIIYKVSDIEITIIRLLRAEQNWKDHL